MNTYFLFDETLPACAMELLETEPLKRISRIDMNCGVKDPALRTRFVEDGACGKP